MSESRPFYSREFPVVGESTRYLLDKIPVGFWIRVNAKRKREGLSMRALILTLLRDWLGDN